MGCGPALVGERKLAPCRKRFRVFIDFVPLRMKWACICEWHDRRKGIRGRRHTSLGQLCIHNPDSRNFGRQGQGQNSLWTSSTTCSAVDQRRKATLRHIEFTWMELCITGPKARGESTRNIVSNSRPITQYIRHRQTFITPAIPAGALRSARWEWRTLCWLWVI